MTQREERFEIDVNASRAEVWRLLTTAEGLASWFGTRASIDLRVDGDRVVGWGDEVEIVGRISEIDPQNRLRVVYLAEGEEIGAEEWLITTHGATTRLTLINSMSDDGIDDWDGFYGDIRRGWRLFLESLRYGLEDANRSSRRAVCRYIPAVDPREGVWRALEAALTEDHSPVAGMETVLLDPPHSRLLADRNRTLLLDIEGNGPDQVLYVQASTHAGETSWSDEAIDFVATALGK